MNKLMFIPLTAALALATTFTLSCSGGDDDGGNPSPGNGGSSSSVVDGGGSSSSGPGAQSVAPTVTTTALPGGTVGTAYSQTLAATGDAPITWSLEAGGALPSELPTGLALSAAGVISGTPTAAGTFNFTVKATNGAGSNTKALSIVIGDPVDVIGATLRLYNKPVIVGEDAEECTATNFGYYYDYEGKQSLGAAISGTPTATITSGMNKTLTISLDAPKPAALSLLTDGYYSGFQYTVAPSDAKYWNKGQFWESTGNYYLELISGGDSAELFYVDKDVTIEVNAFTSYTITLQAGWNYKIENTYTRTLPDGYNWTLYLYAN